MLVDLATGSVGSLPKPAGYSAPHPLWSPDGSRIAFFATREEPLAEPELWALTVEEKVLSWVAELHLPNPELGGSGRFPEWLSDGRIGFYSEEAIWSIRTDGSGLERLTSEGVRPSLSKAPSVSIAGNRMAFVVSEYSTGIGGYRMIRRIALLDLADKRLVIK